MSAEQPADAPPPATAGDVRSGSAWWLAVAVIVATVAAYFQTFVDLWPKWTGGYESSYTHGLLIAAVSLWLVWRARTDLRGVAVRPALWALPAALALSLFWLVAARASIMTVHATLWPLLCFAMLLAACGWRVARAFAFPLAYLWFAVPLWDFLVRPLQTLTIIVVGFLNRSTRVDSEVVGDFVVLPQGTFEIAAGCSGLHFFMVALAMGALAGEVHRDRWPTRLLLVALAAALGLVTNWLRVYIIILAGYLSDMQHYLVTVDHYKFGWVVFAVAMVAFFFVLNRLPVRKEQRAQVRPQPAVSGWRRGYLAGVAALLVLPAASAAAHWINRDAPTVLAAGAVEGFVGPLSPSPFWRPVFVGPDAEIRAAYLSPDGRVIDYYANAYLTQSQGHELIGPDNQLFDPQVFNYIDREQSVRVTGAGKIPVVQMTVALRNGERWVVMYHYRAGGRRLTGNLEAQLYAGFLSLWGAAPAGIHAVAAPCGGDCETVGEELASLLARLSKEDP